MTYQDSCPKMHSLTVPFLGMGMLASRYPEDRERGIAMGIALGGLAFGCIIGPTFGGFMYEFVGKSSPFVVLAALALADAILQLLILQPKVKRQELERPSLKQLLKDPYICIAAGGLLFGNMGFAVLEPTLPSWMERTICAAIWQQGAVYLACSISYLIGTNVFAPLGHKIGRWLVTMLGLILMGISLVLVPEAKDVRLILGPLAGLGFSIAMVDASIMPELARLVDLRHSPIYGTVYAVGDVAFCLGFAVGMGMLASRYPEDRERGIAMGIALGGLAFGCIIGPTFGGFMYEFVGKSSPFVVLAALALADAILQLLILQPKVKRQELERPSLKQLLKDPYICIAADYIPDRWTVIREHGIRRPRTDSSFLDGTYDVRCDLATRRCLSRVFHLVSDRHQRFRTWLVTMLGLILMGISLVLVPEAKDVRLILGPLAGLGFSIAMVDASIMPELARLVDLRHSPIYGTVYAVGDVAFCLGFAVGPALAGALVQGIGFDWMLYVMAIVCFLYSPLFSFLRKPPARGEKRRLLEDKDVSSSDGGLDGSSTHELVP
ncbi:unnamed protein product [Darwinula stevensoni]|uniref:Major facilitator superfamily (MFS) profile domain-containing protein n=1 Tax=Darwinula stevensoni TaxID=69355 RepID=A0A7R9AE43_9CRUS|nr:unnamed protein product [Darwinula stevensoni]CAG0901653.1 unnamed protein product [Darwinula stevensoni]